MKFEDLLMQPKEDKQNRADLQEEVDILEGELDREQKLNKILQCALQGPIHSCPCLSSLLPPQVQELLAELNTVEEEITFLERKIDKLKLSLYQEKKQTKQCEVQQLIGLRPPWSHPKQLVSRQRKRMQLRDCNLSPSLQSYGEYRNFRTLRERRVSIRSSMDIQTMSSASPKDNKAQNSRCLQNCHFDEEISIDKPNKLSEELVKCLIRIYLKMNEASLDNKGSAMVPKHSFSCMNSKGLISKTSFNWKAPTFPFNDDNTSNLEPYDTLQDFDGTVRGPGPYKNFIQITRTSLETNRISEYFPAMRKLRLLMNKLCKVDLTFLTYKEKLAFWINIYNASIMHVL